MNHNIITELDEQRLDELMAYAPAYSEESTDTIKRLFLQKAAVKRKSVSGKRIFTRALIAAVLVAVSGIAVAAGMGVDFGRIYNSFFNNPAAEHKIEIGQSIENNGMEVALLSAFTDGNRAHALLELSDISGTRLSDSIRILSKAYIYGISAGPVSYDEKTNTATLALTVTLNEPVSTGDRLSLPIDTILSGIKRIDAEPIAFDLAAHAKDSTGISQEEWNDAASGGMNMPGTAGFTGDVEPNMVFLPPDKTALALDGIDWAVVTNIGVIDGYLHLQIKETDAFNSEYNRGYIFLLDRDGNQIHSAFGSKTNGYEEMAFEVSDDLSAYRLAVSGEQIENVVQGPWNMSFVIESELPEKTVTVIPGSSPYFTGIDVTCSPISTSIWFYSEEATGDGAPEIIHAMSAYYRGFGVPYLTLKDGSVIPLEASGSIFDNAGGSADLESVYFDISKLKSITICGEEYFF